MLTVKSGKTSEPEWPSDPSEIPLYSVAEVAMALRMLPSVLAEWTQPNVHQAKTTERFRPLIEAPPMGLTEGRLSFYNVIEAHVLLVTRRYHHVPMLQVRRAVEWARKEFPSRHPLADYNFETKGKHLFVKYLVSTDEEQQQRTTDATSGGQQILGDMLDAYLDRIKRDDFGVGRRLFPVVPHSRSPIDDKPVMMDINMASGKLVISETGILASVVHGRFRAGHSVEKLARDYRLSSERIQGAIDYLETAA